MVDNRKVLIVLCCYLLFTLQLQAATLTVIANKSVLELGKYVSIQIIYTGNKIPAESNVNAWAKDFLIKRGDSENETLSDGKIQYSEYLRLYPRNKGIKTLDALALGGAISKPIDIQVTSLVRQGIDTTPQLNHLPTTIWQGQSIDLLISQYLLKASNQLLMKPLEFDGFTIQSLKKNTTTSTLGIKETLAWRITPHDNGYYELDLPMLMQRGRTRLNFALEKIKLKVKPIPSYVPTTVPIGKLSIQAELLAENKMKYWIIDIVNEGTLDNEIYGLRKQLDNINSSMDEFEPETHPSNDRLIFKRFKLSVPLWHTGLNWIQSPQIQLVYFDTKEGRLKSVATVLPRVWNIPSPAIITLKLLLFVFCFILSLYLIRLTQKVLNWRAFILFISNAQQLNDIRTLLLKQSDVVTMSDWSEGLENNIKHNKELSAIKSQLVIQINQLSFAQTSIELEQKKLLEIKQSLISLYRFNYWLKNLKT